MTITNSPRKKRTKQEIVAAILITATDGASKTRIMYRSLLSFSQIQKYLSYVLAAKLLDLDSQSRRYITTNRGLDYLKHFQELQSVEGNIFEKRRMLSEILQDGDLKC